MKSFSLAKPSLLILAILAASACSNEQNIKAVDRVEEAAAIARVQGLEARAEQLKNDMPAATEASAGAATGSTAGAKPTIQMPDESTIPDDEYGAAVRRGLQIILIKSYLIMSAISSIVLAVT